MADEDGILDPVTYVILLDSVQEGVLKNDTALAKGAIIAAVLKQAVALDAALASTTSLTPPSLWEPSTTPS